MVLTLLFLTLHYNRRENVYVPTFTFIVYALVLNGFYAFVFIVYYFCSLIPIQKMPIGDI